MRQGQSNAVLLANTAGLVGGLVGVLEGCGCGGNFLGELLLVPLELTEAGARGRKMSEFVIYFGFRLIVNELLRAFTMSGWFIGNFAAFHVGCCVADRKVDKSIAANGFSTQDLQRHGPGRLSVSNLAYHPEDISTSGCW